jgi:signal transduction histidine kinase
MGLRLRLFVSHAVVIVIGLLVLSSALVVLLVDYQQRLMLRELSFVATTLVRAVRAADLTNNNDQVMARLSRVGQDQRFQILLLDNTGSVTADDGFNAQNTLVGRTLDLSRKLTATGTLTTTGARDTPAGGSFRDAQRRLWVYVAVPIRPNIAATNWMAIARPAVGGPLISLLGESLVIPFIEAGLVAFACAALLAYIVARSIARPVQKVAAGANAVALGKYDQRVAVSGPPEIRQLAEDFNLMAARVQTAQTVERDFVANVSHELKTPLTSIKGFAQAIRDGAVNDPAGTQNAARIIYDEAERLSRLVTSLLESARLETGDVKMMMTAVSINEIARACLEKLSPRVAASGVRLESKYGDLPAIQADGDRLAQVVTNLVDNALKHTPGGGRITFESQCAPATRQRAAGVEFSVSDTGAGIPAEDLPRVFERFYQVDKARTQGNGNLPTSTGLGLAICKQIVEAHHGTIMAQSVLGIGTRMTVWLPVSKT